MRVTATISAAAATLFLAGPAAAAGRLGWALGNRLADGNSCKTEADYDADLAAIRAHTSHGSNEPIIVRTYSAKDCDTAARILPAAARHNVRIVLGIWVYSSREDDPSFLNDLAEVRRVVGDGGVSPDAKASIYAVTVGSESLYRRDVDGGFLAQRIRQTREALDALPGGAGRAIRVGTADSWNKFDDGTIDPVLLSGDADILLANAFSYWQGQEIGNATSNFFEDITRAFGHAQERITSVNGGRAKNGREVELWVGETGWPSAGNTYGKAVPTLQNAERHFREAVCGILGWGFNVFYFEAFDEPGKQGAIGEDGTKADESHWGAMTAERQPKWQNLWC